MKTLKEKIEVMQAAQDGKQIEIMRCNKPQWDKIQQPLFNWEDNDYRVKPEPKLVPLEMADIPPVCWVKYMQDDARLVIAKRADALQVFDRVGHVSTIYYQQLIYQGWLYSSDGVNFKPCSKADNKIQDMGDGETQ